MAIDIKGKIPSILPEISTVLPNWSTILDENVENVLIEYGYTSAGEVETDKKRLLIVYESCLLILIPALDYYKSRMTTIDNMETQLDWKDRIAGLKEIQAKVEKKIKDLKEDLEIGKGLKIPIEWKKVTEDSGFYVNHSRRLETI